MKSIVSISLSLMVQYYALQGNGILFLILVILGSVLLIPVMFVLNTQCALFYF